MILYCLLFVWGKVDLMWCIDVRNVNADHAASHVGKAQGFVTLIRAVHYHARRNNVYLPRDVMMQVDDHTHCALL